MVRRKLTDNFKRLKERINAACERSGRPAEEVRLIAVTKTVEVDVIRTAIEMGLLEFGENKVQMLVKRAGMVHEYLARRRQMDSAQTPADPNWHMVGHLQRNKVRMVLPWAHMIHSLDSLRLAEEIGAEATRLNRTIPCLIEVNVSGEKNKHGIAVGAASHFANHIANLPGISITGLMTMAPLVNDAEKARPYFCRLREVFEDMVQEKAVGPNFRELSMGMSNDFEAAIEEGATIIRIGRELFNEVV